MRKKHITNYRMLTLRTDIAKEACENVFSSGIKKTEYKSFSLPCQSVEIISQKAEEETGKRKGKYISIESSAVVQMDRDAYENISRALASEIRKMIPQRGEPILVAGLGNRDMTPDSIGALVIEQTLVTRHLFEFAKNEKDERMRPVSAIAPGVLGVTGIESADIISSVAQKIGAKAIIVVDALAAKKTERLFSTFQISSAGIEPGAGVGNKRSALTASSAGVPVIAVGVPTVIYASSLVYSAIMSMMNEQKDAEEYAEKISSATKEMVVTPKEIDVVISDAAKIIADGINLALHDISLEELREFQF